MPDADLNELFPGLPQPIQWDEMQEEAIRACCDTSKRIVAVTGKAGTGKTMMIREVARRLSEEGGYVTQTCAPTGKAAKRIREVTGLQAMTNHRMLGYGMPREIEVEDDKTGKKKIVSVSTGPRHNRLKPMPYDTILCDEYAMVNQEINRNLIDALPAGGRICMFGDVNQLKPIEEDRRLDEQPSAFQNALSKFGGITLDTIHRHDAGSGIARNGALILQGRVPRSSDDFTLRQTDQPVIDLQEFIRVCSEQGHAYNDTDHQIITCMNKSWIGTSKLNVVIQAQFWDRTRPYIELPRYRTGNKDQPPIRVQVGSKVVYTANSYDLSADGLGGSWAFNGEVGIVGEINHADGSVEIDFGDRTVVVPPLIIVVRDNGTVIEQDPRRNIDLAYVLTTHKCQGSEFKHVCYVINRHTQWAQSRRNFYTAVTRAREHCTVYFDAYSMAKSTRYSG
jgi:exodeoxyribonuclease V alpha subunit